MKTATMVFMLALALALAWSAPARAEITDPNMLRGDTFDDGRTGNYPAVYVDYEDRFTPDWYQWPINEGVLHLQYGDVAAPKPPARLIWDTHNYGGSQWDAPLDLSSYTDVYLVLKYKASLASPDSSGGWTMTFESFDGYWTGNYQIAFEAPVNTADFVTVILNIKRLDDTDPLTWNGQGKSISPYQTLTSSIVHYNVVFGSDDQQRNGPEVCQAGDSVDVDYLALTTDYTPYLPPLAAVPDISGLSQSEATSALEGAGFTVSVVEESSDSIPAGGVIRTEPAAGTDMLPGSSVQLVISSGPAVEPELPAAGWAALAALGIFCAAAAARNLRKRGER